VIARVEQGQADRLNVVALERLARPLGARIVCRLDWNGEALDRLLDADHAAIVDRVVRLLLTEGWTTGTEVSFNIAGERGSIDVLAWHPVSRSLLVIEVKSVVADVQGTLFALDRKVRLGPRVAAERAWPTNSVSRLLVVGENRTTRRRIEAHSSTFGNAFPDRTRVARRWIASPPEHQRPLSGLMFLPGDRQTTARHRVSSNRSSPEREARQRY
jgi:hypothetical protein